MQKFKVIREMYSFNCLERKLPDGKTVLVPGKSRPEGNSSKSK